MNQPQPNLPPRVDDILLTLLENDREDRYLTAADLRADLRRAKRDLDGVPASTIVNVASAPASRPAPSSDAQVIVGMLRRRRGPVVIAAVVVVGVVTAMSWWLAQRERGPTESTVSLADLTFVPLTETGTADMPAISADGRFLAYVEQIGSDQSVWIRQIANSRTNQIVPAEAGASIFALTVSPEGDHVDFVKGAVPGQAL